MATLTYFTVENHWTSVIADDEDIDTDPEFGPVTATVTFTPMIQPGDVIRAVDLTPEPTSILAAPIVARIETNGDLVLKHDQPVVRLVADTDVLNLETPLFYRVDFTNVRYWGREGILNSFTFQAPSTDTVINLTEVMPATGTIAVNTTRGPRGYGMTGDYLGPSADETDMEALVGVEGDWTIRADTGTIWVFTTSDGWVELSYPDTPDLDGGDP